MIGNKTIVGLMITTMVLSCVAVAVTADEGPVEPMGILPGSITTTLIADSTIVDADISGSTDITLGDGQSFKGAQGLTVSATNALTVTGGAASTWSTTAGDLTIEAGIATPAALKLISDESTVDAVTIDATVGGIDITTGGSEDIDITGSGGVNIQSSETHASALTLAATGAAGGVDINTTNGIIAITAGGSDNGDITLTVGDDFTLNGVADSAYAIGASTVGGTIAIGGTAQTGAITLGSSSAGQTVNIGTGAGASDINIGTDATAVNTIDIGADSDDTVTIHGTVVFSDDYVTNDELAANAVPTLMTKSAARVSTVNASYNDGYGTTWTNNTWNVGSLSIPRGVSGSNLTIHYSAETDVSDSATVLHVTCNVSGSNADTADIKFGDYAGINQTYSAVFYATGVTDGSVPIKIGYRAAGDGTVGLTNQTIVVVAYPA